MIWYFKEQDIRADALKEGIDIGRQEGIDIGRQEGIDIGRQEGIFAMIALCLEDDLSQEHIVQKLQKHFKLMPQETQEYLARYYQKHK